MSELFTDTERAGIPIGIAMDGTVVGITHDLLDELDPILSSRSASCLMLDVIMLLCRQSVLFLSDYVP